MGNFVVTVKFGSNEVYSIELGTGFQNHHSLDGVGSFAQNRQGFKVWDVERASLNMVRL